MPQKIYPVFNDEQAIHTFQKQLAENIEVYHAEPQDLRQAKLTAAINWVSAHPGVVTGMKCWDRGRNITLYLQQGFQRVHFGAKNGVITTTIE